MSRTRRKYITARQLVALQILSIITFYSNTIRCSAEDELLCSEGVCVPEYLCRTNGTVKRYGEDLIDTRFTPNECPIDMVCCRLVEAETNSIWSEGICNGRCLPASECEAEMGALDLEPSDSGCAGNNICCKNMPKSCDGVCISSAQCSDGIDLRLNIGNCPAHQVCCRRPLTINNDVCRGKCVPPNQCSDYNPVIGLINLRYSNGNCPANQICCNNVKLSAKCDGLCLPRARCDDSGIDLRFDVDQCPNQEICCHKPKSSGQKQDSTTCRGICLPAARCPSAAQTINLRISEGCAANEVCCNTTQSKSCNGTCTTVEQCVDARDNTNRIDLRSGSSECPNNKICCKNLRSDQTKCDGTCVPQQHCPELNTWNSVISLRSSVNRCPFKQVCCKNPVSTDCDGKCVPQLQCNDNMNMFDLRSSATKCPVNSVCCKNLKQSTGNSVTLFCDGECVAPVNCPNYGNINTINLRITDGACPDGKICCKTKQKSELCIGSCIPRELCDDKSIDLRFNDNRCPGTSVCCKKPKVLKPLSTISGSCDGTCLPSNLCSDKETINLRAFDSVCPGNQICCKVPKQQSVCDGICASLDQCLDVPQNINLRLTGNICPSNQICCKNLKTPKPTCNGKCVPTSKCSMKVLSSDPFDLRFGHVPCAAGEVCCQNSEVCDGSCVPKNQCEDISISDEINLRFGKPLCPVNQVCCKKARKCDGSCVPTESCSSVDLRLAVGECPLNQVCCKVPDKSEMCEGLCTQPENCIEKLSNLTGINLRSSGNSCPQHEICCQHPKSLTIDMCEEKCVLPKECTGNNIDLRSSNGKCSPNQVCCKTDSCNGACVLSELCADEVINLRYMQKKCPMNRVCCQKLKESTKAACPGQCVLPWQCPNYSSGKYSIDLRAIDNGCSTGQICCDAQISFLPPSLVMDIPNAPTVSISSTSRPTTDSSDSNCAFSSDPSAEYVVKTDVPWLVTIWSRQEILGMQRRQYECVGTLIKSDLVLTSADCLKGYSEKQLYARVGDFNLKPINTLSARREINIAEVTVHPDFNSNTGYANFAVLRLSKNASRSSSVCLPEQTKLDPMAHCFLVGWNKQALMNESIPNALPDKHAVALTTTAKCDEGYICSGANQSQSQCAEAFQGSPVICFIGSSHNWIQMGLTVGRSEKCNTLDVPHSFVSIASHEMWIKEQITPSFQQITNVSNPSRTYLPPVA